MNKKLESENTEVGERSVSAGSGNTVCLDSLIDANCCWPHI